MTGAFFVARVKRLLLQHAEFGVAVLAGRLFSWSVTSMQPGEWVIASAGRDAITAACGVTPQAQNTGSSSGMMSIGSPKSGLARSATAGVFPFALTTSAC